MSAVSLWQKLLASAVAAALATALALASGAHGFLPGQSLDTLFWLRQALYGPRNTAATSPVALILIDEASYQAPQLRGLSKEMWTPFFALVLGSVTTAQPAAIGFDIILPASLEPLLPGYERSFRAALRRAGAASLLVMAKFQGPGGIVAPPVEQVMAAGGAANIRSVNMEEDADGIVRRARLLLPRADGTLEPSFAAELAARANIAIPGPDLLLNWDGGHPFAIYSFADLLACAQAGNGEYFKRQFAGKIVLLATGLDVEDRLITSRRFINQPERITGEACTQTLPPQAKPIARASLPGVFVHAAAIDNLSRGDALRLVPEWARIALTAAAAIAAAWFAMRFSALRGACLLLLLLLLATFAATLSMQHALVTPLLQVLLASVLSFTLLAGFRYGFADRDGRRLRRMFGLYVSPGVIEALIQSRAMPKLGGEMREMTFFFSDIEGFTGFAASIVPERLAPILNAYFDGVCEAILRHGGMVVDFAGDGVHAIFGAPALQADHAARAIAAARAVAAFSEQFRHALPQPLGHTRIGLHSGQALAGNFGGTQRLKYASLGDAVNTASRLEGLNKVFGTQICLSAATAEAAGERDTRPMGDVQVMGRAQPVRVLELLPPGSGAGEAAQRYLAAYALLAANCPQALATFATLAETGDNLARFYRERLRRGEPGTLIVMAEK